MATMTAPNAPSVRRVIADAITYHPGNRTGTPDQREPVSLTLADAIIVALKAWQPYHVVDFWSDHFHLEHSMACRLDDDRLLDCPVDAAIRTTYPEGPDPEHMVGWRWNVDLADDDSLVLVERVCRQCGCTDARACMPPCSWAEASVCTACAA